MHMDDWRDRDDWYDASRDDESHTLQIMMGGLLAAIGAALIFQAARGRGYSPRRSLQMHGSRIEIEHSIEIAATPEQVYDEWRDYENFPRFMSMVEEVRSLDGDRSHWVVKGPAGTRVSWDSVLTAQDRGRLLAWRSEPGSLVDHGGRVELRPAATGTNATVRMSYEPPGGRLGHAVASLFGRNPRQDLERDLQRMKEHIEHRHPGGAGTAQSWERGAPALPGSSVQH
jgi:uncharacterized membrane protein